MKKNIDTTSVLRAIQDNPLQKAGFYAEKIGVNRVSFHAILKTLLEKGYVKKQGKTPHTHYTLTKKPIQEGIITNKEKTKTEENFIVLNYHDQKYLNTFYKYLPDGTLLTGRSGITTWAQSRGLDTVKTLKKFLAVSEHIENLRNPLGFLDATKDFQKGRNSMAIDELYFLDQYIYAEFGRGPLAELTFHAKAYQDINLLNALLNQIIDPILTLIHEKKVDAIAMTPPSIQRKHQLLTMIEKKLAHSKLPFIDIYKYFPSIPIAQKTLKTREQREQNARSTIQISLESEKYKRVLLVDDFVGSGATLDITAEKLKARGIAKYIVGVAIIGNLNLDYEVINEV